MMTEKINLTIEDFEDKKSQNGKRYTRFKTSEGWASAFDKDVIDALKANEGKEVCVDLAIDEEKGFKNIRGFNNVVSEEKSKAESPKETKVSGKPFEKDPIGLCVELVSAGKSVEEAVKAVKEIQAAFQ